MSGSIIEITGNPPDPDCLHCELAPIVDRFHVKHPEEAAQDICRQVLQVAAEILASGAVNAGMPVRDMLPELSSYFRRVALDSETSFLRRGMSAAPSRRQ